MEVWNGAIQPSWILFEEVEYHKAQLSLMIIKAINAYFQHSRVRSFVNDTRMYTQLSLTEDEGKLIKDMHAICK